MVLSPVIRKLLHKRVVLASASPRRREILSQAVSGRAGPVSGVCAGQVTGSPGAGGPGAGAWGRGPSDLGHAAGGPGAGGPAAGGLETWRPGAWGPGNGAWQWGLGIGGA